MMKNLEKEVEAVEAAGVVEEKASAAEAVTTELLDPAIVGVRSYKYVHQSKCAQSRI
jgi:hypothetical protein